jgi:hypothetical protein
MDLPTLEWYSLLSNWAVVIFTVLAALAGIAALHFSSLRDEAKDKQLDEFQKESSVSISQANARAAEANKKAAEAGEGAAKAVAEQEKLRQENLSLSLRVEAERKARLEIERALAPRQLLLSERMKLIALLRSVPTTPSVISSKAANSYHFKTGQRRRCSGRGFLLFA